LKHLKRMEFRINIFQFRAIFIVCFVLVLINNIKGQDFQLHGQISGWGTGIKTDSGWNKNLGLRYFPQLNYSYQLNEDNLINGEILLNTDYNTDFKSDDYNLKLYRAILRYTSTQTEVQLGLQKINFGPAQLLRTLMWFDMVDPRDPLKLTDGVYGLRYKYSFLNNSILWVWGLYENNHAKEYEIYPTANKTPEWGGRYQLEVPLGEVAATVHTRVVDAELFNYRENRFALDGRWDIGIGIWFESALQQSQSTLLPYPWNKMLTVGGDYTFGIGNGIYFLAENLTSITSVKTWGNDIDRNISAIMTSYPAGTLDNFALQIYYDWKGKNIYQYYLWQRTYDNLIINLALFHYPQNGTGIFASSGTTPSTGYGLQLMLIYNY
jgi:hypothetical protein